MPASIEESLPWASDRPVPGITSTRPNAKRVTSGPTFSPAASQFFGYWAKVRERPHSVGVLQRRTRRCGRGSHVPVNPIRRTYHGQPTAAIGTFCYYCVLCRALSYLLRKSACCFSPEASNPAGRIEGCVVEGGYAEALNLPILVQSCFVAWGHTYSFLAVRVRDSMAKAPKCQAEYQAWEGQTPRLPWYTPLYTRSDLCERS